MTKHTHEQILVIELEGLVSDLFGYVVTMNDALKDPQLDEQKIGEIRHLIKALLVDIGFIKFKANILDERLQQHQPENQNNGKH